MSNVQKCAIGEVVNCDAYFFENQNKTTSLIEVKVFSREGWLSFL